MSTDPTQPLRLPDTPTDAAADPVRDAPTPKADPGPVAAAPAREIRVGTVVWGLVVVAIAVLALTGAAGVHIDIELAFIALLAGAGMALLVGSLAVGIRRPRGRR